MNACLHYYVSIASIPLWPTGHPDRRVALVGAHVVDALESPQMEGAGALGEWGE